MKKVFILMIILAMSCSKPQKIDNGQEKEQILKYTQSWADSETPEEYMDHVTDDFIYISEGSMIANNDSMYNVISNYLEWADFVCPVWNTEDLVFRDNQAIHKYSADVEVYLKENDSLVFQSKRMLVDILRKTDEGWKVHIHMYYNLN